jgi:hypothetical protein
METQKINVEKFNFFFWSSNGKYASQEAELQRGGATAGCPDAAAGSHDGRQWKESGLKLPDESAHRCTQRAQNTQRRTQRDAHKRTEQ